jgi:hypothetical protein
MADGVDLDMERVEPSRVQPQFDRVVPKAKREQLAACDNAVLLRRKPR